ncbi:hypothetical protein QLS91_13045 [Flavobacterium sp. LB2P84]|uniref:hypothetical protein n=1 Tax=Flavobacterium TaxID=237 RepID=UPI0010428E69|nr:MULTISPECIES: hypothetical protein [Flavobacterium]MDI6034001.1 hypothetical protein [Flavobacterium yafengii]TDE53774.1 hypothetical protein E0H99_07090 [Flavobacterium sp. GT3P67]
MTLEDLQQEVKDIVNDTIGSIFSLNTNGKEWTINITKGATIFKGSLEEVLSCYIEEITSYREPRTDFKHVTSHKKYIY